MMLSVLTRNNDEKPSFSLRTNSVLSGADVLAPIFPEILILLLAPSGALIAIPTYY